MVKRRPVIVVSSRASHARQLCTVVPISTTAPAVVRAWHVPLPLLIIPGWHGTAAQWAKCDMLCTVSFERLNHPYLKSRHGGRRYEDVRLLPDQLTAIRVGLRAYLGIA